MANLVAIKNRKVNKTKINIFGKVFNKLRVSRIRRSSIMNFYELDAFCKSEGLNSEEIIYLNKFGVYKMHTKIFI